MADVRWQTTVPAPDTSALGHRTAAIPYVIYYTFRHMTLR
jgi:hypothetical protein